LPDLNLLIGNRGGGKTTALALFANYTHQGWPTVPIVGNTPVFYRNLEEKQKKAYVEDLLEGKEVPVPHTILHRDSLRWLAVKTILKDSRYALFFPDEASLAEDLESRGSHSYSTVPRTWLIALSRKINIDNFLVTQMMSMVDKRVQWLGDFYTLCIGHYIPETVPPIPQYFEYKIHNENMQQINGFEIDGEEARQWLFPRFHTADIPISEARTKQIMDFFAITDEDKREFAKDMIRARDEYRELQRSEFILEQARKFVKRTEVKQEDMKDYKETMGYRG